MERASKLHFCSIVVDIYSDSLSRAERYEDLGQETGTGDMGLPLWLPCDPVHGAADAAGHAPD